MTKPSIVRSRWVALVAIGAAVTSVLAAAPAAQAKPSRHVLSGSRPKWLGQAKATGGTPAAASTISFGVLLKMRDAAGAEATLASLSDPASASYGKWLSSAQFRARYAPAAADVASVRGWLTGQGFHVRGALGGGLFVQASGTTAQIDKVFGTKVQNYQFQGKTVRANNTDLSLPEGTPSSVTGAISGVLGIDQGGTLMKPADPPPPPSTGFRAGRPCSAYYGQKIATAQPPAGGKHQPYVVCGYEPKQYESAYGLTDQFKKGYTGKGVTVAVTDAYASPTIVSDTSVYNRRHGLPQFGHQQFTQITPGPDGYDQAATCGDWYGEETLDIESVHSMAPGANVVYVGAADCADALIEAWAATIDNHVADIVTNSWGDGVDDPALLGQDLVDYMTEFSLEAALTGITVNFSSGDDGDATAGGANPTDKTVSFPSDIPYVTGVGGTSVGIDKHGKRVWEYGWQNAYQPLNGNAWGPAVYSSGGGGGTSVIYPQPFYQRGVVPVAISEANGSATPMRTVPDISMPADPNTGFLVGQTQTFTDGTYYDEYRLGGTSLASPLLAGVDAVVSQRMHHPIGFANPLYYKLIGTGGIRDIVAPKKPVYQVRTNFVNTENASGGLAFQLQNIDVQTSLIHSVRGYDDETGLGTPGPKFFNLLK